MRLEKLIAGGVLVFVNSKDKAPRFGILGCDVEDIDHRAVSMFIREGAWPSEDNKTQWFTHDECRKYSLDKLADCERDRAASK